jgi:hypothetical protein
MYRIAIKSILHTGIIVAAGVGGAERRDPGDPAHWSRRFPGTLLLPSSQPGGRRRWRYSTIEDNIKEDS